MSTEYTDDIRDQVTTAATEGGIVNVPVIARHIHDKYPKARLFDIEHLVLGFAELSGVPIVFDLSNSSSTYHRGLLLEFVTDDDDDICDFPAGTGEVRGSRADDTG